MTNYFAKKILRERERGQYEGNGIGDNETVLIASDADALFDKLVRSLTFRTDSPDVDAEEF